MSYVSNWFQKGTWEKIRKEKVLPKPEWCGGIVEKKYRKTEGGFHGEYIVSMGKTITTPNLTLEDCKAEIKKLISR